MPGGVILGDGGHARVLALHVNYPLLGKDDPVPDDGEIVIGVGDMETRRRLFEQYRDRVASVVTIYLPGIVMGRGVQVMRGVIMTPPVVIGENVLINTGAQIDHDCMIGGHCVIAPGAILCGGVTLGEGCFVGAGAIIVQGVTLEPNTFVPAGTLVAGLDDMRVPERKSYVAGGSWFSLSKDGLKSGEFGPNFSCNPDA